MLICELKSGGIGIAGEFQAALVVFNQVRNLRHFNDQFE
jgi:hypothetical protein